MNGSRQCSRDAWYVMTGLVALLALSGCAVVTGSAFEAPQVPEHVVVEQIEVAQADQEDQAVAQRVSLRIEPRRAGPPPADYVVGPNDVLYINIFGNPGLGSPVVHDRVVGSRVDGDGQIQLPMIQTIRVGGLRLSEIQALLQERYAEFIAEPWVVVEVVQYRSQPIYLIGEFNQSGVVYMDRPTNVVQAIALGRGLGSEAYLRGARLIQNDQVVPVDIYELLREGALDQNVWLEPGDTIYVPDNRNLTVFVLGEVENPGMVPMVEGKLTLPQALSLAGGYRRTGSTLEQVRIIRSLSATRGELIVVNLKQMLQGQALAFPLEPGDIVFIPRSRLGEWNDMLREILPTLQTVSSVLQPFVQLLVIADRS